MGILSAFLSLKPTIRVIEVSSEGKNSITEIKGIILT